MRLSAENRRKGFGVCRDYCYISSVGLFEKARDDLEELKSQQEAAVEFWSVFTPRARQVFALARDEAMQMNQSFIGAEHLLLGLIGLGNGVAVNVLKNLGLDLETVRAEVVRQAGVAAGTGAPHSLPPTPQMMRALNAAKREAKALDHAYVGTEHILLGLLAEPEGVVSRIFKTANVDCDKTRQEILTEITPVISSPQKEGKD